MVRLIWCLIASALVLTGCGDNRSVGGDDGVDVNMTSINLAAGDSTTVTIANPSGATVWKTSDAAVVSVTKIDDHSALVRALGVGTATLTITTGIVAVERSAVIPVTITAAELRSIGVTPPMPQLAHATMLQMSAVGIYSDSTAKDLTAQVVWASDTTAVASVDSDGIVLAGAAGTANLSATLGAIHGEATITVTQATLTSIAITPPNTTFGVSFDQQLTATGTFSDSTTQDLTLMADWTSSAAATATVNGGGLVHGVAAGTATITATLGAIHGSTGVTITPAVLNSIEVDPATPTIAFGGQQQFTAVGHFSDGLNHDITAMVAWSSDTTATATIDPVTGLASAVAAGTTTITATLGTIHGSTLLTVSPAVLQSIVVTPNGSTLAKGRTLQFTAMGIYTDTTMHDITATVTWTSTTGATISNAVGSQGLAMGAAVGTPTITATQGTIHGDAALTVTAAELLSLQITPVAPSAPINYIVQLTATGTYSDATTADLTTQVFWDSTDLTTVEVSNANGSRGLATTFQAGTPTVSAALTTTSGTVTGTAVFTVTNVSLMSINVTPTNPNVALGLTQPFTATGIFSDATVLDLTTMVAWTSGTPANATISNAAGSQGLATTVAAGTSLITATFGPVSGASTLTVNPAELTSITISPINPAIAAATTQQFTATGHYTDSSTQNLTTTVVWTSSVPAAATIDPATGLATAVANGSTTITATFGTFAPTTTLTVGAGALLSIAVTPATPSIAKGQTQQFTATGTFADTSTQNLTTQVTWSSSDGTAAISNVAGTQGLATGLAVGTPTITATLGAISGTTTLTVTAAVVVSIAVTPATATVSMGNTQAYVATGTFSDATTANITSTVTWTTGLAATATVSTTGTRGIVTGQGVGSTTVIATQPLTLISGNATVNVVAMQIKAITPTNGISGVKTTTPIEVSFDRSITAASITVQAANDVCSGTLQVSSDDFATCIGLGAQTLTGNIVSYLPAAALSAATVYKIKLLGTITNGATIPVALGVDLTQTLGWEVTPGGTCTSPIVISQIYGAGGNVGATLTTDFVELHNRSAVPQSLAGTAIEYAGTTGTSWTPTALPAVSIPAGGYFLIALHSGANGAALPTPDFTGSQDMGAAAGKVALTESTIPLTGSCANTHTLDEVGYGPATDCSETIGTIATSTTASVVRTTGGCDDTDSNKVDFVVNTLATGTPPRNSATTPVTCAACP
jgi:uncharacterized protein YjdB